MPGTKDARTDLRPDEAGQLLAEAVEAEVVADLDAYAHVIDTSGQRHVICGRAFQSGLAGV